MTGNQADHGHSHHAPVDADQRYLIATFGSCMGKGFGCLSSTKIVIPCPWLPVPAGKAGKLGITKLTAVFNVRSDPAIPIR